MELIAAIEKLNVDRSFSNRDCSRPTQPIRSDPILSENLKTPSVSDTVSNRSDKI
jgi:hypothetical protein